MPICDWSNLPVDRASVFDVRGDKRVVRFLPTAARANTTDDDLLFTNALFASIALQLEDGEVRHIVLRSRNGRHSVVEGTLVLEEETGPS